MTTTPAGAPALGAAHFRRRLLRLRFHAALLGVVLVALVPLVGTGSSFSADEGAAIIQARSLADGGGWVVEHPVPGAGKAAYPLELSEPADRGFAPYGKHPLYPLVLSVLDRLGGATAMVLLSVLGTWAAAVLAALVAREVGAPERAVLWLVGLGSPLLFDGYLVMAHAPGAALVTGAVLCALRARAGRGGAWAAGAAACLCAAVLLRTEALLVGLALAAAVAVGRRFALAGGLAAVAGGTYLLEDRWQSWLTGTDVAAASPPVLAEGDGLLGGRVDSFTATVLRPDSGPLSAADLGLLVAVVAAGVGALALRRRAPDRALLTVAAGVGLAGTAVAFAAEPARVVPGLLAAFPLAALAVAGRRAGVVGWTAGLSVLAIVATQYTAGGTAEWGGRYFAVVVPLLAVLAVGAAAGRVPAGAVGAAVVATALVSLAAVGGLRDAHQRTAGLLATVEDVAETVDAGDGGPPVIVATHPALPRLAWRTFFEQRWLRAAPPPAFEELVVVGPDLEPYEDDYEVDEARSRSWGRWPVSVLVRR